MYWRIKDNCDSSVSSSKILNKLSEVTIVDFVGLNRNESAFE